MKLLLQVAANLLGCTVLPGALLSCFSVAQGSYKITIKTAKLFLRIIPLKVTK